MTSLFKSTSTVGGLTLISRVLGFVRDMIVAQVFGAGGAVDAFFVAFKIPNFMRRLFAEGAFSQAFVPVLVDHRQHATPEQTRTFAAQVSGTLGGILLLISIVGMLAAPWVVTLFAPGFRAQSDQFGLTVELLRITFPYILFIALTACASSVLNAHGRYALPALTPVILNIVMIAAALWASTWFAEPIMALAWGVALAGVLQLLFQLPALARMGMLARPRWAWRTAGVQRVASLMIPTLFGASVTQINLLIDTIIASFLAAGSVSWLYYADRLLEFPVALIGVALGTVLLPTLAAQRSAADGAAFSATLDWGLRWVVLTGVPATVGLCVLASPIVITLFQYGQFTAWDARMAAWSVAAYAVGVVGFLLVKVLAPGCYAREDMRAPVRAGLIAVALNIVLSLAIVGLMHYLELPGAHAGLALATALAAFVNAAFLWRALRAGGLLLSPGWRRLVWQVACATVAMAALLLTAVPAEAQWLSMSATARALHLLGWITGAAAVYFAALWLTGNKGSGFGFGVFGNPKYPKPEA